MNERSVAIETMNDIRELGVGLSLDDFGTGYSSLSRLAHLPIRELKIDRSFMQDIERDASALAVATAVVRVGQSLKMTVVAEGVETEGQRDVLKALGCDVIQGFLFAPALAPEAFERWLLTYSVEQASTMLRRLSQSLSRPNAAPPAADASDQRTAYDARKVGWAEAPLRRAHPCCFVCVGCVGGHASLCPPDRPHIAGTYFPSFTVKMMRERSSRP